MTISVLSICKHVTDAINCFVFVPVCTCDNVLILTLTIQLTNSFLYVRTTFSISLITYYVSVVILVVDIINVLPAIHQRLRFCVISNLIWSNCVAVSIL
jgi:hypothetical protein